MCLNLWLLSQVIKLNNLQLVSRLHVSEQTWTKTAEHFTVFLASKVRLFVTLIFEGFPTLTDLTGQRVLHWISTNRTPQSSSKQPNIMFNKIILHLLYQDMWSVLSFLLPVFAGLWGPEQYHAVAGSMERATDWLCSEAKRGRIHPVWQDQSHAGGHDSLAWPHPYQPQVRGSNHRQSNEITGPNTS